MLLVSAVTLAAKRAMTQARCKSYLECMSRYINGLAEIHPDTSVRPYHHMSMHLPHFFYLFGPARAFWTYPYERLIGQIQRLMSNHKLGKAVFRSLWQDADVIIRSNGLYIVNILSQSFKSEEVALRP